MDDSPLARALERVGDRWMLLVVDALLDGPRRFNELSEDVVGIAPNILTQRLRRLEQEALVFARPPPPPPSLRRPVTDSAHGKAACARELQPQPVSQGGWK